MDVLVRRALSDPVFLRYRYRPICAAHTTPTTTTTHQTTFTLTSEPPSTVDLTTKDEPMTLTLENSTSAMLDANSSRYLYTEVQSSAVRSGFTLNDLVVASLLTVLVPIYLHFQVIAVTVNYIMYTCIGLQLFRCLLLY